MVANSDKKRKCNHLYTSSLPNTPCLLCGKQLVSVLDHLPCKCEDCVYWRSIYELEIAKKPFLVQRTISFRTTLPENIQLDKTLPL